MQLPNFNTEGQGPQGTGGIPPESIRQVPRDMGQDLSGSQLKPEDSPAAQQVLQREVDALLGLPSTPLAPVGQPQAPAQAPTTPVAAQAPPASPEQPPAQAGITSPEAQKVAAIHSIISKYGGNVEEVAKAYLEANTARHAIARERNGEISELQTTVKNLYEMVATALMPRTQAPGPEEYFQPQPQQPQVPTNGGQPQVAADFFQSPEPVIERIVGKVVRENMLAAEAARTRAAEIEKFNSTVASKKAELDRLGPIVQRIYQQHREVYSKMSDVAALDDLLDRAKKEELLNTTSQIFANLQAQGVIAPGTAVPSLSPGASLPMGGGTLRTPGEAGQAPPGGNWSATPGMQRLMRSTDGSQDELAAATKVLEERGFGNVPIY